MKVSREGQWLIVEFSQKQEMLSWALVGGGRTCRDLVVWRQVTNEDLKPPLNPKSFFENELKRAGFSNAVGLMTSAQLESSIDREQSLNGSSVRCVGTIGLNNAVRVGDFPKERVFCGTINLLCHVDKPLSEGAMIEAVSIAAEARTAALISADIQNAESSGKITGTGTDCVVIAAPRPKFDEPSCNFIGKHTSLGALLGRVVYDTVLEGAFRWKEKRDL